MLGGGSFVGNESEVVNWCEAKVVHAFGCGAL